ncbi:MAG: integrase [Acidovorax sp.]
MRYRQGLHGRRAVRCATQRAYAGDLRHFLNHGGALPATSVMLAEYLARCAEKLSVATLESRVTAIHKAHLEMSAPSPALDAMVKHTLQGIRRTLGTKQRQAKPMVKDDVLAALVLIDQQAPVKATRDRAVLLVGFASAMCCSELVAVRVERLTELTHGIEIFLPSSKTAQERAGRTVLIPQATGERCPVRALKRWLEIAQITDSYVFRAVTRHDKVAKAGLNTQSQPVVLGRLD